MPLSSGLEGGTIRDEAAAAAAHLSILGLDRIFYKYMHFLLIIQP